MNTLPRLPAPPPKVFFSYRFDSVERPVKYSQKSFAAQVRHCLAHQSALKEVYLYEEEPQAGPYPPEIGKAIAECGAFVLFAGENLGETQIAEAEAAWSRFSEVRPGDRVGDRIGLLVVDCAALEPGFADAGGLQTCWPAVDAANTGWVSAFQKTTQISLAHLLAANPAFGVTGNSAGLAQEVARLICFNLGFASTWVVDLEIPKGYPFAYEKSIIETFIEGKGRLGPEWLEQGCPEIWPQASRRTQESTHQNSVPESLIGQYSDDRQSVVVDVRVRQLARAMGRMEEDDPCSSILEGFLTFAEARPRRLLAFPKDDATSAPGKGLSVGVVVSGGIAPGINSVISGIVERHRLYQHPPTQPAPLYHLEIHGFANGFQTLVQTPVRSIRLDQGEWRRRVQEEANRGGSLLGTSRMDTLLNTSNPALMQREFATMVENLRSHAIDILYVIGGDGSMRAAHALQVAARAKGYELSVVGVPKTMDNDVLWVWQSFGFLSAVEKAKEFIEQLHTEARSNPRLCVMQLFGSDSGFVVSHAALASGAVDLALIPEVPFSMKEVSKYVCSTLEQQFVRPQSPYGLVLMAETAIPTDVEELIAADEAREPHKRIVRLDEEEKHQIDLYIKNGRRVRGQTPDALRTGGLKIVARVLQDEIKRMPEQYWKGYRVFTNEPRHLLRSLEPSASDIIFGHRLGCLAVDNALAGYTDFMVSQWLTEFVLVPLRLVILGRKRVPTGGIFWRSVLDATGQPADLDPVPPLRPDQAGEEAIPVPEVLTDLPVATAAAVT